MIFVYIAWLGTAAYLVGHIYLAFASKLNSSLYYGLNLFGAIGFIIGSSAIASWQSVFINIFWAYISLASLRGPFKIPAIPISRWWLIGPSFMAILIGGIILAFDYLYGANILGWSGTALYIFGYYLFASASVKKWQFLIYNSVAAIILLPIYGVDTNWPAFALSLVWSIISIFGLWKEWVSLRES